MTYLNELYNYRVIELKYTVLAHGNLCLCLSHNRGSAFSMYVISQSWGGFFQSDLRCNRLMMSPTEMEPGGPGGPGVPALYPRPKETTAASLS